MSNKKEQLNIIFFDINGVYDEDSEPDKNNDKQLESPKRILTQYTKESHFDDLNVESDEQSFETIYTFTFEFKQNKTRIISCHIIDNFSLSHSSTNYANGYVIFFNLEVDSTTELKKLIEYIQDECSREIKIYVIGIFETIVCKNKEKMDYFLAECNVDYEYYEMYGGADNNYDEMKEKYKNSEKTNDVFKNLFNDIYQNDGKTLPKIKKTRNSQKNANIDQSMNNCVSF